MLRMAVGHSDDVDLEAALDEVFSHCDAGPAGATPRAGLLLSAWGVDHRALPDAVRARYPGITILMLDPQVPARHAGRSGGRVGAQVLGDAVPVGGFYCLGEIAPMASPDLTRFHNATIVSVLLRSAEQDGATVS